jgi:hypothetical protein
MAYIFYKTIFFRVHRLTTYNRLFKLNSFKIFFIILLSLYLIYEYLRRLLSYDLKILKPISCLKARKQEATALLNVIALLPYICKSDIIKLRKDNINFVVSYMNVS